MPQGNDEPSLAEEIRDTEERLHIYGAIAEALRDPHGFLQVLMDADDPDLAGKALREKYGFDLLQAQAVLDLQLRRTTTRELARIVHSREELADHLRDLRSRASGAEG